jgi:capsular exopolysaccharide synthesis family protein
VGYFVMDENQERFDLNGRGSARQLVAAASAVPATREPYGSLLGNGYADAELGAPGQLAAKLLEYWRIINKRKWLIISIAAAFVLIGAVRTLMQTPLYTATARLQIDRNVAKIVEGDNVVPLEDSDSTFMRTQVELLQSRTMAERVVSALDLTSDTTFLNPRDFSPITGLLNLFKSSAPVRDDAARGAAMVGVVLGNRAIRPVARSRLVDISYSDPNPERSRRIANAFADAYVASNLDKRFQANASAKTFLEDKIQQLKIRLEHSEKKLLAFAQQQQIVDLNDKTSIAEANLASANVALGTLVSERTKNEELWKQVVASDAISLPQLLSNSVIDGLRKKRNELELEYRERLPTFKPDYPAMVQIKNQIDEIDQQLAREVQTIKDSLKASYESSMAQEGKLRERISELRQDVLDLQKRSIQYNMVKREVDTNRELYTGLLQRYKEVDVASGVGANNIFVVDGAQVPGSPSSPRLGHALGMALLLGLGAGLGAAYLLERLDDKLRAPEQVEMASGLSILGAIPAVGNVDEALADPRSVLSEAYRSLCTTLQFSTENGLPRTLLVTSAASSEGKSLTSYSIARHFALLGRKVLLVDADLRNPSLHRRLQRDNSIGLSNYLTGACKPPAAFQSTHVPRLMFMASGPLPPNAADLLGSTRLFSLLSVGSEVFECIILDGPPVLGLADAQLLSGAAAATVFVVSAGQSRAVSVQGALKRLRLSRANVVGAILTKFDAKSAGYGYGYGYGYSYGDGATPRQLSIRSLGDKKGQQQLTDAQGSASWNMRSR